MDVDAFLCDHAEVAEGKLFLNGGGVSVCQVPPEPPHVINIFLAAVIHVPYTATNETHTLTVTLLDEDGNHVLPWIPPGMPDPDPVVVQTEFTIGRPAVLAPGEAQPVPVAFGFQGLPIAAVGAYSFVVQIDGAEERRLPFRVMSQPMPGSGPTAIPRL